MGKIKNIKVALVYDRVNKWGGAERLLLALHELFPNAPLFTSVYDPQIAQWANVFTIKTSFLQKIPFAPSKHEWLPMFMPFAFENFSFTSYDLVISITSEAAKGIIVKAGTVHVCYCLTPTRYLWSGYEEYFTNPLFRFITKPFVWYLRKWDLVASQRPDAYIAISKEVQRRIKKYYKRDSSVVYPPVGFQNTQSLRKSDATDTQKVRLSEFSESSDYFLVVSRLVPYKRIDITIKACNDLALHLKIIGSGSEEKHLRNISGTTIEFLGNLTEDKLVEYYKGCKALIFPGIEDFGLTVLEAQSFGKPVIAYKGGGALETIKKGVTGDFFYPQTATALIETLRSFNSNTFDKKKCIEQAEEFNKENFKKQFMQAIKKYL